MCVCGCSLEFSFGVHRRSVGVCWWREITACAEHLLDFVHCFSLGLGDDEEDEERSQNAEHCEHPESVVYMDGVNERLEEFRDEEGEKPVGHTGDRTSGTCVLKTTVCYTLLNA